MSLRGCLRRYPHPFGLSLSKGGSWFDKLTTNGLCRLWNHPLGTIRMLLAGLGVGALVALAACGSQETAEPAHDDAAAPVRPAAPPQPEPASPTKPEPSPEPTEAPVASPETQSRRDDPWGENRDPFSITSVVENGRRYEVLKILPKDAIRAIFSPNFFTPEEANSQYRDTDLIIGVSVGDEHRAYNVAYLSGHEIVNDVVGGRPIAVTW